MKILMFLLIIIAVSSCKKQNSKNESENEITQEDITKIRDAYTIGLYFINVAQIAQNKAISNEVKEFAAKSIESYKQMNKDILGLAAEKSIPLPKDLTSEQKEKIQQLLREQGNSFDKKIVNEIKDSSRSALSLYQDMYVKAEDYDISYWALYKLSKLHDHLDSAIIIHKKFKTR